MDINALAYDFITLLKKFEYSLSGSDRLWKLLFPDKSGEWQYMSITQYQKTFYVSHVNGEVGSLEIEVAKKVLIRESLLGDPRSFYPGEESSAVWVQLLISAKKWLERTTKDWIKTNKKMQEEYPLHYRKVCPKIKTVSKSFFSFFGRFTLEPIFYCSS